MDDLEGVALVTGSSSGIGAAIARRLAASGMTVVINFRSSRREGEPIAREIRGSYLLADIGDEEQARSLVRGAVDRYSRLHLLVNNAGTTVEIPA